MNMGWHAEQLISSFEVPDRWDETGRSGGGKMQRSKINTKLAVCCQRGSRQSIFICCNMTNVRV